jgi:hypothetical protein
LRNTQAGRGPVVRDLSVRDAHELELLVVPLDQAVQDLANPGGVVLLSPTPAA